MEIAGLDTVEYEPDIYLPEVASAPELLVEPDGTLVDRRTVIHGEARELVTR